MKLQDYLHYYIGCKVKATPYGGQSDRWEEGSIVGLNIHNVAHVKFDNWQSVADVTMSCIKPILRRLEDMTEGEWFDIEHETSIAPDAIGWHGIREAFMTTDSRHRWHWTVTNEVLIILRKRGVDVDNLIPAGLAIDAKTLTT